MNEEGEKERRSGDYDQILSRIGDFGKFQKLILVLLSCLSAAGGLVVVVFPFTAYQINYRWRYGIFCPGIKLVEIIPRCSVGSCEENSSYSTDSRLPAWYGGQDIDREGGCPT